MNTIEEICKYIKRHKNTPDLHSAVIHTKNKTIFLNYDYGCFDVSVTDSKSFTRTDFEKISDILKFIGTNKFERYEI